MSAGGRPTPGSRLGSVPMRSFLQEYLAGQQQAHGLAVNYEASAARISDRPEAGRSLGC